MSTEDDREKRREESPEWHRARAKACGSTASRRWRRSTSRSRRRSSAGGSRSRQNSARLVRSGLGDNSVNERDFPHPVELALPLGWLPQLFLEFDAFHRQRRTLISRLRRVIRTSMIGRYDEMTLCLKHLLNFIV